MPLSKLRRHLDCGEYLQARSEAERLIRLGELTGENQIQAYRGGALAHYHVGEMFAAVKLGEKALAEAMQVGVWGLIGKARYDLGEFHLVLGDYSVAQEYLAQFLDELELYADLSRYRGWAHHKLGLIHRYRREYLSAIAAHELALECHREENDKSGLFEATRGIVWCHLTMGQPDKAWPHIQGQITQADERSDPRMTASTLTDLAYYYQQTGDLSASMEYCAEVIAPGRPGVDAHVLATACVIAGENALVLEHLKEARIFTSMAQEYALQANQPALINRTIHLRHRLQKANTPLTPVS